MLLINDVSRLFRRVLEEVFNIILSAVSGSLFSATQIRSISVSAAGLGVRFVFPGGEVDENLGEKIEQARAHIASASGIVHELSEGLETRAKALDELIARVEEKKKEADHFSAIADANAATLAAFRSEIELAIRTELEARDKQGRLIRQLASAIVWIVTLILGAALGAYFLPIVAWAQSLAK
jgi:hypothetical protein